MQTELVVFGTAGGGRSHAILLRPMIQITPTLAIDEAEVELSFIRSSGAGGQNVNKVATAVQLRFDVAHSPSLPPDLRERLMRLAGRRMGKDGVLAIKAWRFRTQERNRQDALDRLAELIRSASHAPRLRRETAPTFASKRRRLETKRRRAVVKTARRLPAESEE